MSEYYVGDNLTVQCYPDHVFIGTEMTARNNYAVKYCLEDGTWSGFDEYHCYSKYYNHYLKRINYLLINILMLNIKLLL